MNNNSHPHDRNASNGMLHPGFSNDIGHVTSPHKNSGPGHK